MEGPLGLLRQASNSKARLDALEAWKVRRRAQGSPAQRRGGAAAAHPAAARRGGPFADALRSNASPPRQALGEETKLSRDQAAVACDLADTLLRDANWKARRSRRPGAKGWQKAGRWASRAADAPRRAR